MRRKLMPRCNTNMGHEYLFLPESMRLYYSLLSPCIHNLAQNKEIHVRLLIPYRRPHILYKSPLPIHILHKNSFIQHETKEDQ